MFGLLSKKITCFFIKKNAIDETEREIYNYCFEILLSTLINLIAIIIVVRLIMFKKVTDLIML